MCYPASLIDDSVKMLAPPPKLSLVTSNAGIDEFVYSTVMLLGASFLKFYELLALREILTNRLLV